MLQINFSFSLKPLNSLSDFIPNKERDARNKNQVQKYHRIATVKSKDMY